MLLSSALLLAALSAGFLGSPHCLGMCGGIVTAFGLSMQSCSPMQRRLLIASYHVGRLSSYALLGLVAGWIGTAILSPLAHTFWPRAVVAAVLVLLGLSMLGLPFLNHLERLGARLWRALAPLRQRLFPLHTVPRALAAGLLWGFLPCGLVYGALLLAMSAHSVSGGALLMLAFGIGTLPMLLLTAQTTHWLKQRLGDWKLRQINAIVLIIAGLWMLSPVLMGQHGAHSQHNMSMTEKTPKQGTLANTNPSMPEDHSQMHDMPMDHSMHHN